MHTRRTLKLEPQTWDITLDGVGRLALAEGDYATAQNVAGEARLFVNDAYFIQDRGIPHFIIDLGQRVSRSVASAYLRKAAQAVPDVKEILAATVSEFDAEQRKLSGEIRFTTVEGAMNAAIQTYF